MHELAYACKLQQFKYYSDNDTDKSRSSEWTIGSSMRAGWLTKQGSQGVITWDPLRYLN